MNFNSTRNYFSSGKMGNGSYNFHNSTTPQLHNSNNSDIFPSSATPQFSSLLLSGSNNSTTPQLRNLANPQFSSRLLFGSKNSTNLQFRNSANNQLSNSPFGCLGLVLDSAFVFFTKVHSW